jgi:hypothetical protein
MSTFKGFGSALLKEEGKHAYHPDYGYIVEYWHGPNGWEFAIRKKGQNKWYLRGQTFPTKGKCLRRIYQLRDELFQHAQVKVERITALAI